MSQGSEASNLPVVRAGATEKKRAKDGTRRGRPPGAKNKPKPTGDLLAHMSEAHGTTAGQQQADMFMITAKDIRHGKAFAKMPEFVTAFPAGMLALEAKYMTPLELGLFFKVYKLRMMYGMTAAAAFDRVSKANDMLIGFTARKQPGVDLPDDDYRAVEALAVDEAFLRKVQEDQGLIPTVDDVLTNLSSPEE